MYHEQDTFLKAYNTISAAIFTLKLFTGNSNYQDTTHFSSYYLLPRQ